MIGRAPMPMARGAEMSGERRLRRGSGLWGLMQDKSRKVRHGWGGRFFRVFHKVIVSFQGFRRCYFRVLKMLAQGRDLHGPR